MFHPYRSFTVDWESHQVSAMLCMTCLCCFLCYMLSFSFCCVLIIGYDAQLAAFFFLCVLYVQKLGGLKGLGLTCSNILLSKITVDYSRLLVLCCLERNSFAYIIENRGFTCINYALLISLIAENRKDRVSEFLLQTQHACFDSALVCQHCRWETQSRWDNIGLVYYFAVVLSY